MTKTKSANDELSNYIGTSQYHRTHLSGRINYTDGVEALAQCFECRCLLDVIFSTQNKAEIKAEQFAVWELKRVQETKKFVVTCSNDDGDTLYRQEIHYSDFNADYAKMWCIDNVLMLPSEY